jgi:hypothetical protein
MEEDQKVQIMKRAARRLRCMEGHLSASVGGGEGCLDERSLARADEALLSLAYVVASRTDEASASAATAAATGKTILGPEMGAWEALGEHLRVYKTGAKMVTSVVKMGIDFHAGSPHFPINFYFYFFIIKSKLLKLNSTQ